MRICLVIQPPNRTSLTKKPPTKRRKKDNGEAVRCLKSCWQNWFHANFFCVRLQNLYQLKLFWLCVIICLLFLFVKFRVLHERMPIKNLRKVLKNRNQDDDFAAKWVMKLLSQNQSRPQRAREKMMKMMGNHQMSSFQNPWRRVSTKVPRKLKVGSLNFRQSCLCVNTIRIIIMVECFARISQLPCGFEL